MIRFLLILFVLMFCYKQVAEGIALIQVNPFENFLFLEEGQIDPDEENKSSEGDQEDTFYLRFHQISLVTFFSLLPTVENYTKPISGYPVLLFTPPNLQ